MNTLLMDHRTLPIHSSFGTEVRSDDNIHHMYISNAYPPVVNPMVKHLHICGGLDEIFINTKVITSTSPFNVYYNFSESRLSIVKKHASKNENDGLLESQNLAFLLASDNLSYKIDLSKTVNIITITKTPKTLISTMIFAYPACSISVLDQGCNVSLVGTNEYNGKLSFTSQKSNCCLNGNGTYVHILEIGYALNCTIENFVCSEGRLRSTETNVYRQILVNNPTPTMAIQNQMFALPNLDTFKNQLLTTNSIHSGSHNQTPIHGLQQMKEQDKCIQLIGSTGAPQLPIPVVSPSMPFVQFNNNQPSNQRQPNSYGPMRNSDLPRTLRVILPNGTQVHSTRNANYRYQKPRVIHHSPKTQEKKGISDTDPKNIKNTDSEQTKGSNDVKSCKVCFEREIETVIKPCLHALLCIKCANDERIKTCPSCRGPIKKVKRIHLG